MASYNVFDLVYVSASFRGHTRQRRALSETRADVRAVPKNKIKVPKSNDKSPPLAFDLRRHATYFPTHLARPAPLAGPHLTTTDIAAAADKSRQSRCSTQRSRIHLSDERRRPRHSGNHDCGSCEHERQTDHARRVEPAHPYSRVRRIHSLRHADPQAD